MKKILIFLFLFLISGLTMGQQVQRIGKTVITDNPDNTSFNKDIWAPNLSNFLTKSQLTDSLNARFGNINATSLPDSIKYVSPKFTQNSNGLYSTIQSALNASGPNSLILVWPGNYAENLNITKGCMVEMSDGSFLIPVSGHGINLNGVSSNVSFTGNGVILTSGRGITSTNLLANNTNFILHFKSIESTGNYGVYMFSEGSNVNFDLQVTNKVKGYLGAILGSVGSASDGSNNGYAINGDNSVLFFSANNSLYRSTNDGANWSLLTRPVGSSTNTNDEIQYVDGNLFYRTPGGFYKSTNNGDNWSTVTVPFSVNTPPYVNLFSYGSNLFVQNLNGSGFYRSTDYGTTWLDRSSGLPNGAIPAFYDSTNGIIYTGSLKKFYKSYAGGLSWIQFGGITGLGDTTQMPQSMAAAGSVDLYLGMWGSGVYKSTDGGNNWFRSLFVDDRVQNLMVIDSTTIIASTRSNGIYRTTNSGTNWISVANSSFNTESNIAMFKVAGKQYIACNNFSSHIGRSTDNGATWSARNSGLAYEKLGTGSIKADSVIGLCNPPTTYPGTEIRLGKWNVDINYNVANSTVFWQNGQYTNVYYKGLELKTLTNIGHTLKVSYGEFTGEINKVAVLPTNTLYGAVEVFSSAKVFLTVKDTIYGGGYAAINAASTNSFINIKARCILNNSTSGAYLTIFAYCAGIIEADEVKNIGGSGNAKLLDIGIGTGPMVFKNIHFSGYSAGQSIIGIGNNNGAQFQNCIFYNSGGGLILGNYHSSSKNVRIYNCWGNVGSWTTGGVNFNYLIDSIRVDTDVQ